MGRPEKPLQAATDPVTRFASDLRRLRQEAGSPSYRDMARAALFSASVLSTAASGHRLPTLQVALGFAEACGGDREEWQRRWALAAQSSGKFRLDDVETALAADRGRTTSSAAAYAPPTAELPSPWTKAELPVPAQLPCGPRHFVGRADEMIQAWRATPAGAGPRDPVLVTGRIGIGKSAFALRLAHDRADRFPDGQLYADMTDASPYSVILGFLRALAVPTGQTCGDAGQLTGLYRSTLARRKVLIFLDNVRDEQQLRPLLTMSPTSMTLAASRATLLGV
jgi:hypothetical protein